MNIITKSLQTIPVATIGSEITRNYSVYDFKDNIFRCSSYPELIKCGFGSIGIGRDMPDRWMQCKQKAKRYIDWT